MKRLMAVLCTLALVSLAPLGTTAQDAPSDELRQVADDSYAFIGSNYVSFFVVTDEGVIATDPSSQGGPERAAAYAAAIASVTDQPVRYLIYSHHHSDHALGGDVFSATATFVSHRDAVAPIAALDASRTPVPQLSFTEEMTIELGGTTIELYYTGRNHFDSSIVLLHPAQRVAYAVDFVPVDPLPFQTLPDAYPTEWIASLRWIDEYLDLDSLVAGHPPAIGTTENVGEVQAYLKDLTAAITAAQATVLADNSPEMVEVVCGKLEADYGAWTNFDEWLPLNIEGVLAA